MAMEKYVSYKRPKEKDEKKPYTIRLSARRINDSVIYI